MEEFFSRSRWASYSVVLVSSGGEFEEKTWQALRTLNSTCRGLPEQRAKQMKSFYYDLCVRTHTLAIEVCWSSRKVEQQGKKFSAKVYLRRYVSRS